MGQKGEREEKIWYVRTGFPLCLLVLDREYAGRYRDQLARLNCGRVWTLNEKTVAIESRKVGHCGGG